MYLDDNDQREEYIQNDVGKVWKGTYRNWRGSPWVFGQFDDAVLPVCCFILQQSRIKPAERGNAVKVSRAISAMVND